MKKNGVNFDFEKVKKSFSAFVRKKAESNYSTLLYKRGDQLILEDPSTHEIKVIKEYGQ